MGEAAPFNILFNLVVIGTTVLWLLGDRIGRHKAVASFFLALVTMVVTGVLTIANYVGFGFTPMLAAYAIIYGICVLVLLLGLTCSRWCCRKRYSAVRFMWVLICWLVILTICCMLVYGGLGLARAQLSIGKMILIILTTSAVVSGCLYVIVFPFMILAFRSSFYRERFYICLRLPVRQDDRTNGDSRAEEGPDGLGIQPAPPD